MAILDLYQSSEHRNNLAHFAAIVNVAIVDGELLTEEEVKVKKLARKLGITEAEYKTITENPVKYPIIAPVLPENRLGRMLDFFRIIYSDHNIDEQELHLVKRYASAIGYSKEDAEQIITKSIKIFEGNIDIDQYTYLINN